MITTNGIEIDKSISNLNYYYQIIIIDMYDKNNGIYLLFDLERDFALSYELKDDEKFVLIVSRSDNPLHAFEYRFCGVGIFNKKLNKLVDCQELNFFKNMCSKLVTIRPHTHVASNSINGYLNSKAGLGFDNSKDKKFDGLRILKNFVDDKYFITFYEDNEGIIYSRKRYFISDPSKAITELNNITDIDVANQDEIEEYFSRYEVKGKGYPVKIEKQSREVKNV